MAEYDNLEGRYRKRSGKDKKGMTIILGETLHVQSWAIRPPAPEIKIRVTLTL
jgi:hypothetical protein